MLPLQTTNEFVDRYSEELALTSYSFSQVAPTAYDALWSLAFALNKTDEMLDWERDRIINQTGCVDDGKELEGFDLSNFTYDHTFIGCVIRWNLQQTNFTGVSVSVHAISRSVYSSLLNLILLQGLVSFDDSGTRELTEIVVAQYQSASDSDGIASVLVARINALRGKTFEYVDGQSNITVFPGEAIFMVIEAKTGLLLDCECMEVQARQL